MSMPTRIAGIASVALIAAAPWSPTRSEAGDDGKTEKAVTEVPANSASAATPVSAATPASAVAPEARITGDSDAATVTPTESKEARASLDAQALRYEQGYGDGNGY